MVVIGLMVICGVAIWGNAIYQLFFAPKKPMTKEQVDEDQPFSL